MKKYILIFAAVFGIISAAIAAPPAEDLIPRKILFADNSRNIFKLSAGADRVYFTETNSNNIYYIETGSPDKIYNLNSDENFIQWEPLNEGVLLIPPAGSNKLISFDISNQKSVFEIPFKVLNVQFNSKNKKNFNKIILALNAENDSQSGYYEFNASTNNFSKIYELIPHHVIFFDSNKKPVAANINNNLGGTTIAVFDKKNNDWLSIAEHTFGEDAFIGGFSKVISVSDDGKNVWYTSNKNTDKTNLYLYNRENKITREIASHSKVDLLPFGFSADIDGNINSVVGMYAHTERIVVDNSVKEDFSVLDSLVEGDISFAGSNINNSQWFIREFTGGPAKYYLYNRKSRTLHYLINDYPLLDNFSLSKRKSFEVTARDGVKLPVHVYLPAGSDKNNDGIPDKPIPAILYVHGGPWTGVTHWNQYYYWRNFQLLANRGYAVINCEFRGSTGMGKDFIQKSYKVWGSEMADDKADIALWAVKNNIALKDKICIWGWSYGGYAAFAGLAFHPELYACGISMYGISDLEAFGKTGFANNDFWKIRVGNPFDDKESELLKKFSPLNSIDNIKAPLLLTTGGKDDRIPQFQMDTISTALSHKGKEVVYFYYPEEVHDYRQPQSWISFWAVAEQFLSENLGGKFEPKKNDMDNSGMVVVEGSKFIDNLN